MYQVRNHCMVDNGSYVSLMHLSERKNAAGRICIPPLSFRCL